MRRYPELRRSLGDRISGPRVVQGNAVEMIHDGAYALEKMLEAIRSAEREILLEMYWFASDPTGQRFTEALSERVRRGVRVSILYDAVGSWDTDRRMFARLANEGCDVVEYNPIAPWRERFRFGLVYHRDHRKMLIIDGTKGFLGGVNLAHAWASRADGGAGWRDDMVFISGPAVREMRGIFRSTWKQIKEGGPRGASSEVPPPFDNTLEESESSAVQILTNQKWGLRRAIRQTYLDLIRDAKEHVYITNSYFVPDRAIARQLMAAAERGVDVRVLLAGNTDVRAVLWATRHLYEPMLESGIRLYEWRASVLHAKTAVIDRNWCTVGSYNLDHRSFRSNPEVTAAIDSGVVAAEMADRFLMDIEVSKAISPKEWAKRQTLDKLVHGTFYAFRKFL
ncbi:MAG: phospholipase D-like domain-containing protein [Polyangiales bacterium]